jgi:hypothetical protein
MKTICSIFILFFFQTSFSQFPQKDSLISNPVNFNQYLLTIKEIDSVFTNRDSVTRMIDSAMKWKFICSYKKGWEEVIGFNSATSTVKAFRTDFNDIRVLPSDNDIFTTSTLKKLFYLDDSKFIKDSLGNIINGPMAMTKNKKYLTISFGSYYPNGNQNSWVYTQIYYFTNE